MCELCEPYGARAVPEDTRSTTPEDAGAYDRWREGRPRLAAFEVDEPLDELPLEDVD